MNSLDVLRRKTLDSIQKLTDYEGKYNFYRMNVYYEYDLERIINRGVSDDATMFQEILNESLLDRNTKIDISRFGCTDFKMKETNNNINIYRMGRNYDFAKDTSCMLVHCHPNDGYESVGFVALDNIWANDPLKKGNVGALTAPFICLDGMNEKGVSIAVLTLDSEPVHETNKDTMTISTSLAIRLVLDKADNAKNAVKLIGRYNMLASLGRDYHFFISDASGEAYVIEYDVTSGIRPFKAINKVISNGKESELQAVTNFFICHIDKALPNQKNGVYGHGKDRYDTVMRIIKENHSNCNNEVAWKALRETSQLPDTNITSNTQWSIVYNNTDLKAEIVIKRDYENVWKYDLKTNEIRKPGE